MFSDYNNYLLFGLLIKANIYSKANYHLLPIIINFKIKCQKDYLITFMIALFTEKYKYWNNISLIYLILSNATRSKYIYINEFYLWVLFDKNIILLTCEWWPWKFFI